MNENNETNGVKQKSNKGVIIVLIILIVLLAGYIVYDKFISNNNSNAKSSELNTTEKENNNDVSTNINLSDEEIKEFITDGGTQPLLGIYYSEPKEIVNLTSQNDNYLSGMRAIEYCVEQTQSNKEEAIITDAEKNELSKKYNKDFNMYDINGAVAEYTFNTSAKSSTIQKIFEEKTGYKLSNDEIKKLAGDTHYLEKYDKYYYWVSDAFISDIKIESITKENDLYKVKYTASSNTSGTAVLKYNTTTKQINIISNLK